MPTALLLALVASVGGAIASYLYDDDAPITIRLGYGVVTGSVAVAYAGFVAANLAGLSAGLVLGALVGALPVLALLHPTIRTRIRTDLRDVRAAIVATVRAPGLGTIGPFAYGIAMVAFLWLVFDRVILEQDGALATGYVNNLGDLPFHIQVVTNFAFGQNYPPEHPGFAGTGFSYPYISDFLTALFVGAGSTLREGFLLQNLALGLALVALLHRFTTVLTGDRLAGYLAPVIVLLSGGLGWLLILDQSRAGEQGLFALLGALPQDYTIGGEGPFRWGNFIATLLVTQRSLALGLPMALLVFILLWKVVHEPLSPSPSRGWRRLVVAAVLTGLLPLVHVHSFAVVIGTAFFVGLFFRQWQDDRWRGWAAYVLIALALALPALWWSTHTSMADTISYLGIELGWDRRGENPIWFWFINTGLFVPLALAAVAWAIRSRAQSSALLLFSAAFLAWFLVPNVVRLAPWVWDNIKVLIYWFVGITPLVALLLARLLARGGGLRAAAFVALAVLTLAGSLDVWRAVSGQTVYEEFDRDGIALAAAITARTDPRARVLHAPTYNSPVFLTGRRSLLGYPGHIWTHGLPYAEREAEIKRIYAGEPDALALLERHAIDYVVVGPLERTNLVVDDHFFEQFTVLDRAGEYTLYEVARS